MLKTRDLLKFSKHGQGYGYLGHEVRNPSHWDQDELNELDYSSYDIVKALDESLIEAANDLNAHMLELASFADSKMGRWAGDEVSNAITSGLKKSSSLKDLKESAKKLFEKYMMKYQKEMDPDDYADNLVEWSEKLGIDPESILDR